MSEPPVAPLGEVDDYRLLEELRETSSGTLYRARRGSDGQLVFLKRIRGGLADPVERARFSRELAVLQKLIHPHLTYLVDFQLEGERPYFVTEHFRGDPLATMAGPGQRPWPGDELARLAEELLTALQAVHHAGVVLRGLTPAAVIHDDDGRFRIADLAGVMHAGWRQVSSDGHDLAGMGYVPPEVLEGAPHGAAGDLYQLGVLLYEAGTGQAHPVGESPPLGEAREGLPAPLVRLVDALRRSDPGARPASADSAVQELRAGLSAAGRPPVSVGIPAPRLAEAPPPGRPRPLVLGGVLALGLVVGFLLVGRGPPSLHDVSMARRAGVVEVEWRSSRPYPGVVEVVGDGPPIRVDGPRARRHQLRLVAPPEGTFRVELLLPGGQRSLAGILEPAPAVTVGEPWVSHPAAGGVAVGLDTRPAVPVVLRWVDALGAAHESRSQEAGRHHLVAPLEPEEVPREAWLEVEAPAGLRLIPLDLARVRGPAARARVLARRLALRARRTFAEIYGHEGRLVGMQGLAIEGLERRRVLSDWKEFVPLARRLLAAPPSASPGLADELHRVISDLGDVRGVFRWVAFEHDLAFEEALAPWATVRHERRPKSAVPEAPWIPVVQGPQDLIPSGTVVGLSRLLPGAGAGRDRSEVAAIWELPEGPRPRRVELLAHSTGLHHALILEVYLNGVWVGALRGEQPRGMGIETEPQWAWDFLEIPTDALRPGPNRVRLVARCLRGLPISELVTLFGLYAQVVPTGGAP